MPVLPCEKKRNILFNILTGRKFNKFNISIILKAPQTYDSNFKFKFKFYCTQTALSK